MVGAVGAESAHRTRERLGELMDGTVFEAFFHLAGSELQFARVMCYRC